MQELDEITRRIFDALDYGRLGRIYCDVGGDAFWREHREPARVLGARWARALEARLGPEGHSLYVGAGVAEIPAMVREALGLGRTVLATNLRAEECAVLNAAFAAAGVDDRRLQIEPSDVREVVGRGPFDHACLVSVLTDPETAPQVAGLTYGNLPPVLLDVAAFAGERERLRGLVDAVLDSLRLPAVVTTTVDEVPWILDRAEPRGLVVEADEETLESAIVGDPIGFLTIEPG